MVEEWLSDALDESYVSKCVNCGAVTDAMIEANRRAACQRQAVKAHHQP
jgi:hypothetical protein